MIFSIPKIKHTNYYDQARFNLTWKITSFLIIFLPVLYFTIISLGEVIITPILISLLVCIGILISLKKTKSYILPAIIFAISGTFTIQFTLLYYTNIHHTVDTMWTIVIVLFTFFTLGKKWGILISITNLIGIICFVIFILEGNIKSTAANQLTMSRLLSLSISFIISGLLIGYLIIQFINTSKFAETNFLNLTQELKDKNHEKTIMLKEIHHRVKNNLQVITSLLRLQSREITHNESKVIYEESINRIIAMSRIHEKIYQTESFSKIDLEEYVISLSNDLLKSYSIKDRVDIIIKSNLEFISTKALVPISLIFNELISNSLKHAFSKDVKGEIRILIKKNVNNIEVIYQDNGKWKEPQKEDSFGLELIDGLCDQLNGDYTRSTVNGTVYNFTFRYNLDDK